MIADIVGRALDEDAPWGDITSQLLIPLDQTLRADMVARQPGVMAGSEVLKEVFDQVGATVDVLVADGDRFDRNTTLAVVDGAARAVLRGERIALNFAQRLCGIATLTAQYVDAVRDTKARIVDTRKTTPGLRVVEKQAVVSGGGHNHRMSLSDGVLVKDNHIAAFGGLAGVGALRDRVSHVMHIEIEVDRVDQIEDALTAGADSVLCDNFSLEHLRLAVETIGKRALVHASGGVTLESVRAIADTGVDPISVGAITHTVASIDIGLDVR